jgi:hypothetical protein
MTENQRSLLFYMGCIVVRFGIAWLLYLRGGGGGKMRDDDGSIIGSYRRQLQNNNGNVNVLVGMIFFMMSAGFVYHYLKNDPNNQKGYAGGYAWWHFLRPFHAFMWFVAGMFTFTNYLKMAALAVAIDCIVGIFCRIHQQIATARLAMVQ